MAEVLDIKDRSPNAALVAALEELLEGAKSGELRSAIIVTASDDNSTGFRSEMAYALNEVMLALSQQRDGGVLRNL